jgi:DNA-directed RNA polymerase specialized sigma24 family protein
MAEADLVKVVRLAQKVERLTRELDDAREELRVAVVAAHERGESVSELARRLGVTRTRIYQLLGR